MYRTSHDFIISPLLLYSYEKYHVAIKKNDTPSGWMAKFKDDSFGAGEVHGTVSTAMWRFQRQSDGSLDGRVSVCGGRECTQRTWQFIAMQTASWMGGICLGVLLLVYWYLKNSFAHHLIGTRRRRRVLVAWSMVRHGRETSCMSRIDLAVGVFLFFGCTRHRENGSVQ